MNIGLLSWCKILSLVLLCRLYLVACDHSSSALYRTHNKRNSAEIDAENYTHRGKNYTKNINYTPDKNSRSSDDGPPEPFSPLFVLDISNMKDTEFTKYKYKNDHHIFIAKEPFLVKAIKRGFTFLWHSTNDKYPNVVVIYPKENETRRLRLFYPGQNSGFTDPDDEPKQENTQLRGYVDSNKQKKHYTVQTIDVDKSITVLKTKKVAQHESDGSVESDPEPATDIEIESSDELEDQELPQIQPQPKQVPKIQQETPQTSKKRPRNLVRLDINDKWSDQYVEYLWDDVSNADVFVARSPYLLSTIVNGNEILWRKRDGDYPYSVSVTRGKDGVPKVKVYFPGAHPLPLRPPNKKQPTNLVRLDINDKWSDEFVEYLWDDVSNADVFVARSPYLLSTIVNGNEILWRKRDGDYPYAVAVINPGSDNIVVRTYFSEPEYKPQTNNVPEKPKNVTNDKINNNNQGLNRKA